MKSIEWAAGLFEGEGCITTRQGSKNALRHTLDINMTDRDVMENFAEVVGAKLLGPYKPASAKQHHQPFWRVCIGSKSEVRRVLELLLPHLGERRAYKALNCLDDIDNHLFLKGKNYGQRLVSER